MWHVSTNHSNKNFSHCSHCSRLQQFKRYSRKQTAGEAKGKVSVSAVSAQASLCDTIFICKVKATCADRLVEYHALNCANGKFFHLQCVGLKRVTTNHKITWRCYICHTTIKTNIAPPTTSTLLFLLYNWSRKSKQDRSSCNSTTTSFWFDKQPTWLDCDIIQQAHFLLPSVNRTHGFPQCLGAI